MPANLNHNSKPFSTAKVCGAVSQAPSEHQQSGKPLVSGCLRSQGAALQDDDNHNNDDDDDYIGNDDNYINDIGVKPARKSCGSGRSKPLKTSKSSAPNLKMKLDPAVKTMKIAQAPKFHRKSTWWKYVFSDNFCLGF